MGRREVTPGFIIATVLHLDDLLYEESMDLEDWRGADPELQKEMIEKAMELAEQEVPNNG